MKGAISIAPGVILVGQVGIRFSELFAWLDSESIFHPFGALRETLLVWRQESIPYTSASNTVSRSAFVKVLFQLLWTKLKVSVLISLEMK